MQLGFTGTGPRPWEIDDAHTIYNYCSLHNLVLHLSCCLLLISGGIYSVSLAGLGLGLRDPTTISSCDVPHNMAARVESSEQNDS